jgi:hypothetical protein
MPRSVQPGPSAGPHPGGEWGLELCQDDNVGTTKDHARRRQIHGVGTGSQARFAGWVVQWLGEKRDTDEVCRRGTVVCSRAAERRRVSLHVRDRWSSMADTAARRRFRDRWVRANERSGRCTIKR